MAVYKQTYRPYAGTLTEPRWRFWVLARYAFEQVFAWRLMLIFFVLCYVPILIAGTFIYLHHNLDALLAFQIPVEEMLAVNADFFLVIMGFQSTLAFFMTAVVGPGLVSPDLTNGALPLYLSRPFTRSEYVLGKFAVLATLLSLITWIPGMLLFLMQSALEAGWMMSNLRIATAMVAGSVAWILTISLLALALSAWVKWRPVAGAMLFGIFFAGAAFGGAFNDIFRTDWGIMMMMPVVINAVWQWLFYGVVSARDYPLPVWTAFISLGITCGVSLWMLGRKVRAYEVVR
jgi:ABC-2 type transport system permease protein